MEEEMAAPRGPLAWLSQNKAASAVIFVLVVVLVTGAIGLWESPVKFMGNSLRPVASVQSFAQGQTNFDAKLIWSSLSEDLVQSLESQGQEVSSIQSQLDTLKDTGVRYTGVAYVGGYRANNGEAYYLYVFSRKNGSSADVESVPYVFVVNKSGKIDRIE